MEQAAQGGGMFWLLIMAVMFVMLIFIVIK